MNMTLDLKRKNSHHTSSEQEKCPRCAGKYLFNFETGELIPSYCKAYKCPVCGEYKKFKLQKAIEKFVKNWDRVRLWTFTFSSHIFNNMNLQERFILSSKIWKSFRDLIYKDVILSRNEKSFTYIKFVELQENGSPHFHALIDRFIHQPKLNNLWKRAIRQHTDYKGTPGNANVNGGIPKKQAGRYVTKYITKQILAISEDVSFRRWSKSGKGSIFEKRIKSGDWIFISLNLDRHSITSVIEFEIYRRQNVKKPPNQLFSIPPPEPVAEITNFIYGAD